MSDGRKFLKVDVGQMSAEERLASLEGKLPALIERIQSYDKIVDSYNALASGLSAINKRLSDISRDISDLHMAVDGVNKRTLYESQDNQNSFARISRNVADLSKNQDSVGETHSKALEKKTSEIMEIQKNISQISDRMVSRHDLQPVLQSIYSEMEDLKGFADSNYVKVSSHQDLQKSLLNATADLNFQINSVDAKVNAINADFSAFPKQLSEIDARLNYDINQRFMVFFEKVNTRLDALSTKLVPQGISLQEIKSEFSGRLDSFKLDISNSVLKSGNNSQQIILLEKKLENLKLLFNKYMIEQGSSVPNAEEGLSK